MKRAGEKPRMTPITRMVRFGNESRVRTMTFGTYPRSFASSAVRRALACLLLMLSAVVPIGCGPAPPRVAKVGGRVTLDGKPLAKASVTFVPMATKENQSPGPTAQGLTDADGKYQLSVDVSTPGAVVGICRIYISTRLSDPAIDDRDAGGPVRTLPRDKVPSRYNMGTELTFDVPKGGTDQANFALTSN
jgi:hypothetical protein